MKKFRHDYGVYCCPHVYEATSPVLVVIRDPDGYWQFLCGSPEDTGDCHLVGVGHLLERDPSLENMAELSFSAGAERSSQDKEWVHFILDPE
jgi:hypothetical protein